MKGWMGKLEIYHVPGTLPDSCWCRNQHLFSCACCALSTISFYFSDYFSKTLFTLPTTNQATSNRWEFESSPSCCSWWWLPSSRYSTSSPLTPSSSQTLSSKPTQYFANFHEGPHHDTMLIITKIIQTNQNLLAGWPAGAGGRHPVTARKGFFSQKKYPSTIWDLSWRNHLYLSRSQRFTSTTMKSSRWD